MPIVQITFNSDQGKCDGTTSTGSIIPPDSPACSASDLSQPEEYHNLPLVGNYQEPVVASQGRCTTEMVPGFPATLSSDLPFGHPHSTSAVTWQEKHTIGLWHSQGDKCSQADKCNQADKCSQADKCMVSLI